MNFIMCTAIKSENNNYYSQSARHIDVTHIACIVVYFLLLFSFITLIFTFS